MRGHWLPKDHLQSQQERQPSNSKAKSCNRCTTSQVPWPLRSRIQIRPVDIRCIANHITNRNSSRPFDQRPRKAIRNPSNDDLVRAHRTQGHQKHRKKPRPSVQRADNNDIPYATDHQQTNDMYTSIPGLATRVCNSQAHKKSQEPHRSCKQEGCDFRVPESLDDGGEEVLEGLREERDVLK